MFSIRVFYFITGKLDKADMLLKIACLGPLSFAMMKKMPSGQKQCNFSLLSSGLYQQYLSPIILPGPKRAQETGYILPPIVCAG